MTTFSRFYGLNEDYLPHNFKSLATSTRMHIIIEYCIKQVSWTPAVIQSKMFAFA